MSLHSRRNIPIPSFAPLTVPSNETKRNESDTNNAVDETGTPPESRRIRLPVNLQCMIHLDNALQLQLHQQRQEGTPNSDRISFADFCKISSKIETSRVAPLSPRDDKGDQFACESPKTIMTPFAEGEDLPPLLGNLSKTDRFWHDLYCVAVPTLYEMNEQSAAAAHNNDETNGNDDGNSTSLPPKKRRRLAAVALELTMPRPSSAGSESETGSKNRVKELRRLIREANDQGISKTKSDTALRLLLTFRRETAKDKELVGKSISENASSSSDSKKTNELSIVESLLRDGKENNTNSSTIPITTTIDDRIRARAKERERNLEQARAARKDPREERVAIADALYSYACHVLRRKQSRSSSSRFSGRASNQKAPTTLSEGSKCILTFREVVQKGLPNRSRKEIARIMSDIVKVLTVTSNSNSDPSTSSSVASRFLKWKDPKTGEANGVPISKNASITIDTTDFKKVRALLNRKQLSNERVEDDKKH